jgi:hypothetical protein
MESMLSSLTEWVLGFGGMGSLCLSMKSHARQIGNLNHWTGWPGLKWLGWSLLAFSIAIVVGVRGWGPGLVSFFGMLSAATLLVIALITYRPRWLVYASLACVAAGPILTGFYVLL